MTREKGQTFSDKHGADAQADPRATDKIRDAARNEEVTCVVAHQIAEDLNLPPVEIGKAIDLLEYKISKCQLGLFGYGQGPDKKALKPKVPEDQQLEEAIRGSVADERLSCSDAWRIASRFNVPKMTVSNACEALGIKIKPCQLGAF